MIWPFGGSALLKYIWVARPLGRRSVVYIPNEHHDARLLWIDDCLSSFPSTCVARATLCLSFSLPGSSFSLSVFCQLYHTRSRGRLALPCPALAFSQPDCPKWESYVPSHKLTGWIAYSLLEPVQRLMGWSVEGVEDTYDGVARVPQWSAMFLPLVLPSFSMPGHPFPC